MKSKCHIAGHPVHPMLVSVPIGLWVFSLVADMVFLWKGSPTWAMMAAYTMVGGCIGALVAALPGFIDYLSLSDPRTKFIATIHMVINLVLVVSYSANFLFRYNHGYQVHGLPFMLSVVSILFLGVSGWLGGELIYKHKVGVVQSPLQERK